MPYRAIPQDHWREELESISRSHAGWLVRVEVTEPGGPSQVEAHHMPLHGVTVDVHRSSTIAVNVGDHPQAHLTHQIANPKELAFEQNEAGVIAAFVMWAEDG